MSLPCVPEGVPKEYTIHPQVMRLISTPQFAQRTEPWYERRKTLMTASNVASALSIPPFDSFRGCPRQHGIEQLVSGSFKGNVATRHGTLHEDSVRDRLCDIMGEVVLEFGLLVHADVRGDGTGYDWLAASPDGITLSGRMVEIKCPYRRKIVPGHVPHHYMPQVQTQLEVADLDSCYFCQWQPAHLNPEGVEIFDIVLIERDKLWFEKHKDAMLAFWIDLMSARKAFVPPPPPACLIVDSLYPEEAADDNKLFLSDDDDD